MLLKDKSTWLRALVRKIRPVFEHYRSINKVLLTEAEETRVDESCKRSQSIPPISRAHGISVLTNKYQAKSNRELVVFLNGWAVRVRGGRLPELVQRH